MMDYLTAKMMIIINNEGFGNVYLLPLDNTVELGDKECFDKEQIGVKEPFLVTKCQFTSWG